MSFNYDQDVICGEIDNRVKGTVKGVLLFAGWEKCMHFELRGDLISFGGQCIVFHNPRPKVMDQSRYFEFTDGDVVDLKLNKRGCLEFTFESIQKGFIKVKLRDLQFSYSKKFWEWQIDELKSYHELVKDKLKSFKAQQALINQRQNARKENLRGERKVIISRIRQMQAQLWMGDYKDEGESLENLKSWEQHLQMLMDFEEKTLGTKVVRSPQDSLQPYPFDLKPEVIIPESEIEFECWRLIYSLSACSIYLARTDHLSWRELYTIIMTEILDKPKEPLRFGHFNSMRHVDVVYLDENGEDLNLRFYAFLDERQCIEEEYGIELPPIEDRPYNRDKDLPIRASF